MPMEMLVLQIHQPLQYQLADIPGQTLRLLQARLVSKVNFPNLEALIMDMHHVSHQEQRHKVQV